MLNSPNWHWLSHVVAPLPLQKIKKNQKKTDVIDLIGVVVEPGRSLHAHHPVIFAAIGRLAPSSQKPLGDDRQDAPQLNLQ